MDQKFLPGSSGSLSISDGSKSVQIPRLGKGVSVKQKSSRNRTASWATLALSLANKTASSGSQVSPPNAVYRPRKSTVSTNFFADTVTSVMATESSRTTEPGFDIDTVSRAKMTEIFSGRCYDPIPLSVAGFHDDNWKPIPVNETTIKIPEDNGGPLGMHEDQDFYHRELSHEEVCNMFRYHGNLKGLCVVRDSTRVPGHYTMSVWEGKNTINYRIELVVRNGRSMYLLSRKSPFGSIAEIFIFLQQNPHFFPAIPTMYIPRVPDKIKDELCCEQFVNNVYASI